MKLRQITASSLGNTLEWFDFGLFIFLAPIIGKQFFPATESRASIIAAFGVFAAGFICRPLGGIIWGHFGDRYGRAKPLRLSILLITLSTFLVGLLPTYESIGIAAPILFTFLRLIQGLSVGGEYSGIMTYLAESAPANKRGFITSFAATGANFGFLLATLTILGMQAFLSSSMVNSWAWRLPFLFIGFLGGIVSYYRLRLIETPSYIHLKQSATIQKTPLFVAIKKIPKKLLIIFCLNCMSSTFYYVFFGYMPDYLHEYLNIPSHQAFMIECFSLLGMLFLVPLAGALGDYYGRKKMLIILATGIIILSLPCFYLLKTQTLSSITLALTIATLLSSIDQGNTLTTVVENCPVDVRYSGIAFSYNLSAAFFGGLSPLIVIVLHEAFGFIAPAYYIIITGIIGLAAILSLSKNFQKNFLLTSEV